MTEHHRPLPGVYGPQEIDAMVGAYRGILRELSEDGALAAFARSSLSARELRRIAAKQVIAVSAIGIKDPTQLLPQALARCLALRPAVR